MEKLTQENTTGFSDEELNDLNAEIISENEIKNAPGYSDVNDDYSKNEQIVNNITQRPKYDDR